MMNILTFFTLRRNEGGKGGEGGEGGDVSAAMDRAGSCSTAFTPFSPFSGPLADTVSDQVRASVNCSQYTRHLRVWYPE